MYPVSTLMTRAHTFPNVFSGQGCVTPLSPQEPRIRELMPSTFCRTPMDSESQGRNGNDNLRAKQRSVVTEQPLDRNHTAQGPDQGIEVVNAPDGQPAAELPCVTRHEAKRVAKTGYGRNLSFLNPSNLGLDAIDNFIKKNLPTWLPLEWAYRKGTRLGKGSFGDVRLCHYHGQLRAVKHMAMSPKNDSEKEVRKALEDKYYIACEASVTKDLHHSNIVSLFGVSCHRDDIYLALEFMNAGDASRFGTGQGLSNMHEHLLATLARQVTHGIAFIHSNGFIHCDIKPENILLSSSGGVKICDFGISKSRLAYRSNTIRGSPPYMAPEVFHGYNLPQSDIWALGIAAIFWHTGKRPFRGQPKNVRDQIYRVLYDFENLVIPKGISQEFQEFLKLALVPEATQRASAASLLQTLFLKNAPPASSLIPRILDKTRLW